MTPKYFFIDESGIDQGSPIFLVGLVILERPEIIRNGIEELRQEILHDPYLRSIPSVVKNLKRIGFHYSEDCLEVKQSFINFLSMQTFQAYISYVDKRELDSDQYVLKDLHIRLIQKVLFDRILDYRSEIMKIYIEKPFKQTILITKLINDTVNEIRKRSKANFRPPEVKYLGKEESCFSLADYVCGVFKAHYLTINASDNFEKRDFRRIRGKIRVIHDYLSDIFYTRKNPFPH